MLTQAEADLDTSGDVPPVGKTWNTLYAIVLLFQVLMLIAFALFSRAYA